MQPDPSVIEIALEPRSKEDQAKLTAALAELAAADLDLGASTDWESGQTVLSGTSELHLDGKIELLKRRFDVEMNVGAPQVAYRETIAQRADIDHTLKRQIGSAGQFARVRIVFEPGEPGSGLAFENAATETALPTNLTEAARLGVEGAAQHGLLAGFPVVDFKATLVDGAYHDLDSSPASFEAAGRAAFRMLRQEGAPRLLEPVMAVEIIAPAECRRMLVDDLTSRRGVLKPPTQASQALGAWVPLSNMFGYPSVLSALTESRGEFTMRFDHYAPVPLPTDDDPTFSPAVGMRA
jgi:elongation factor G